MAAPGGWLAAARRLADGLLALAQLRLDLLAAEFEREKLRIFDALAWAAIGLLCLGLGALLLLVLLVVLTPEPWRPLVLALLAAGCLGGGLWMLGRARTRLASPGGALSASRAELAADREALAEPAAPAPGAAPGERP